MKNKKIKTSSILIILMVTFLPIAKVFAFDFKNALSKGLEAATKGLDAAGLDAASKGLKKTNNKFSKSATADRMNKKLNTTASDLKKNSQNKINKAFIDGDEITYKIDYHGYSKDFSVIRNHK